MFEFPSKRVYFIAEVGPNHDGDLDAALEIVERVAASGADAVKFQTYAAARNVVAEEAPLARYMEASGGFASQLELLEQVRLSFEDFRVIAEACAGLGITFASTPFDEASVDFLVGLGVPFIKVPSGEITNRFLLRAAARSGLALVVSTGMADVAEIRAALEAIHTIWRETGLDQGKTPGIVLLHCTSAYPAPAEAVNLRAMATMSREFGLPVGYSDHTVGKAVPIAAAALGARVIEKHVTPDPGLAGPDHAASLALAELPGLISDIRAIEAALGDGEKRAQPAEQDVKRVARRSLAAARDIDGGEIFAEDMLTALRPDLGISAMTGERIVGRRAKRSYRAGELIDPAECGD